MKFNKVTREWKYLVLLFLVYIEMEANGWVFSSPLWEKVKVNITDGNSLNSVLSITLSVCDCRFLNKNISSNPEAVDYVHVNHHSF